LTVKKKVSFLIILVVVLSLLTSATAAQETDPAAPVTVQTDAVSIQPQVKGTGYTLTIAGPDDFYLQQEFESGESFAFSAKDMPDGVYKYEIRALSSVAPAGYDEAQRGLAPVAKAPVQSGSFSILDGSFVLPDVAEGGAVEGTHAPVLPNDQVILDDLIVDGSLCVGFDCVNGESFGFDTIRLKENNLRIHFQDTSTSASFPTNDWRISINDSANGGASYFAVQDVDHGTNVFVVEASAGSNALYVDDYGRVGLGTSTPAVELEVRDGDTPTVRLNQDGSSGWSAQTWDLAGNEANFFIRDVTNGSQLPFRIQPGADSNALTIKSDNSVGIGTWTPDAELDIESSTSPGFRLTNASGVGGSWDFFMNTSTGRLNFRSNSTGNIPLKFAPDSVENLLQIGINGSNQVDITGNLVVSGDCSEQDGACAPDYVFEDDYELLTLAEVDAYIAAYGHLPNVPSGAELEAKGINVMTFNYLLLEKVEELTLYTLQQQQIIKDLEARIQALEDAD
jgi:hypothetical protein